MLHFKRFIHKRSNYAALFPGKLLNKKHKTPANMYIVKDDIAELINNAIEPFMERSTCTTAVEINPGIGLLTRKLLNREERIRKIVLIETLEHFMPTLQELHTLYPERVKVKNGDINSIWKLIFQDKLDNGTRVADLLEFVPKRDYADEPNALLFGAVGSYLFFKQLINSLVFQNGLFNYGRFEMFLAVPPPIYIHLTCSSEIGYLLYRSTSMLFQMMFEHRFITKLPREDFLPLQAEYNLNKSSKLKIVKSINPEYLYLVRIVPRKNFFQLCPVEDLPALWYFTKQNCISRRTRVIPNMEKIVPGCGARLIMNSKTPEPTQYLYDDEAGAPLPKYSVRCTTMTNCDFYPNMNIFTQFGDLTPSQLLTLFTQFRQWPEYGDSSFLASLENSLLKIEVSSDESIDEGIGITEEDDIGNDEINMPTELVEEEVDKNETVSKNRTQKANKTKQNHMHVQ